MYGRKGRIGLIVLDSDLTIEPDLRRLLPEGIEIHATRVTYPRWVTPEHLEIAANGAVAAVEQLLAIRPAAIAWACTSGSFCGGRAGDELLARRLRRAAGSVPVTTASTALATALGELGVKRPIVGSPYSATVNDRLATYLREYGFPVETVARLHQVDLDDYALQDVEDTRLSGFMRELAGKDGDAVVVSCTGLGISGIVPLLEQELAKPIITSNLAILWHCWRIGGIDGRPTAQCRLFDTLIAPLES